MVETTPSDLGDTLSPATYEQVFYSIQNPALVIDLNFTILDLNEAAVDFLGYEDREELLGAPVESILANPSILDTVATQILQQEYWTGDAEIETADGHIRMGLGTAAPIEVAGGPTMIAGVFTDMTERRRYTHSLKILNRILRHNIRNDVTLLLGSLHEIAATADQESVVTAAETATARLENIVGYADTARELEVLLRGQDEPALETYRLDHVVAAAVRETRASAEHATIEYREGLAAATVIGLASIDRVVREVLDNAVTHHDGDSPLVQVSIEESPTTVSLCVSDDGPGIPPDQRNLVLGREELGQLHHGEGFSLFFVDQVMDVIGGDVRIEDSDLGGTAVVLEFPRPH